MTVSPILNKAQMTEEDIKLQFITPAITAKWSKDLITMETKITDGKINLKGNLVVREKPKKADYVLYLHANQPIAIVEAKDNNHSVSHLLFSITGEVGTLGLIPEKFGKAFINQHTAMIRFVSLLRNKYIPYLLLTDYAHKYYNGNQHGIKNSFRLDTISFTPIPLPPLAEQKRIVARLEELLPLCEALKS